MTPYLLVPNYSISSIWKSLHPLTFWFKYEETLLCISGAYVFKSSLPPEPEITSANPQRLKSLAPNQFLQKMFMYDTISTIIELEGIVLWYTAWVHVIIITITVQKCHFQKNTSIERYRIISSTIIHAKNGSYSYMIMNNMVLYSFFI